MPSSGSSGSGMIISERNTAEAPIKSDTMRYSFDNQLFLLKTWLKVVRLRQHVAKPSPPAHKSGLKCSSNTFGVSGIRTIPELNTPVSYRYLYDDSFVIFVFVLQ